MATYALHVDDALDASDAVFVSERDCSPHRTRRLYV